MVRQITTFVFYIKWYIFLGILLRKLRSPQDKPPKLAAINCRQLTNNGSVAVCDENIEIRTTTIEEMSETTSEEEDENRDELEPIVCNPGDENCNNNNFDR